MAPELATAVECMTNLQKLDLIGEIWDMVDHDHIPLTAAQQTELERRMQAYEQGEITSRDWQDIKAEWRAKLAS